VLGRSVAINFLGQTAMLVVGFVAAAVLARWLGPSDRGLLAIAVEVGGIAVALASGGVTFAVLYFASRPGADRGAILGNTLLAGAVLAAIFIPVFWLAHGPIAAAFSHGHGKTAWILTGVLVPALFLDWAVHNQLVSTLRFGWLNALRVLSKLIFLLLVVVLVGAVGMQAAGGMIATIAMSAVVIVGSLAVVLRDTRPRLDRALFRSMGGYGARLQIGWLFQILNYRLDVIVLQFFAPLSAVGYYVVAQVIAELVITLARAFQLSINTFVPHFESQGEAKQAQATALTLRHHGILAAGAVVLLAALGPPIVLLGFGDEFRRALVPMLILLPGMWFLGTGSVVAGDLRGRGRPGLTSILAGIALVVTVAGDFALIPPFGVTGAAVASVIAYTVFGIASVIALSRVTRIPVRTLVVPTRDDLAFYPVFVRRTLERVRVRFAGRGTPVPTAPD
jgi:stage V sporulation protein B